MVPTKGGGTRPTELKNFKVPPVVAQVYGSEYVDELDIMFAVEDPTVNFPHAYKWYRGGRLACKGDGERAIRKRGDFEVLSSDGEVLDAASDRLHEGEVPADDKTWHNIGCPCPLLKEDRPRHPQCRMRGSLMVLLYKVSMGMVYQIDTGSFHNIVRVNSAMDFIRGMVGRLAMVPLKLRRQETQMTYEGKTATHYLLSIELDANLMEVAQLRTQNNLILERVSGLRISAPRETEDIPMLPAGVVDLYDEDGEAGAPRREQNESQTEPSSVNGASTDVSSAGHTDVTKDTEVVPAKAAPRPAPKLTGAKLRTALRKIKAHAERTGYYNSESDTVRVPKEITWLDGDGNEYMEISLSLLTDSELMELGLVLKGMPDSE